MRFMGDLATLRGRCVARGVHLALAALFMAPHVADAAPCALLSVTTWYNTVIAGPYRLQFDDHDPPGPHGYRWITNTAMRILHPDGTSCMASEDIPIVALPIYLAGGRYLYMNTYSGSDSYLYVVDARNCATMWRSPDWYGVGFGRTKTGFYLPSVGWLRIRQDCLPGKISGKKLPPSVAP